MMALGDVAAKLGLPVFPCLENKRPAVETGFRAASTDATAILNMFRIPGAALIGVPTGQASGLVIIDIDPRHGGDSWLTVNADALPPTRTHRTMNSGLHLVFRCPEAMDIRNSAGRLAPGVDVRGNGGYACWPPSPGYQIADHTEPADMPRWLIKACLKPEPERKAAPAAELRRITEGGTPYALAGLDRECRAIATAPDGAKHDALNRGAYSIAGLVAAGEIDEGTARTGLRNALEAIRSRCEDFGAAERTLEGAFAAGLARPRAKPEPRPTASFEPPAHMVLDQGYYDSLEREFADYEPVHEPEPEPVQPAPEFVATPIDDLDLDHIPPREWIYGRELVKGFVSALGSIGGVGKTAYTFTVGVSVVLGRPLIAHDQHRPSIFQKVHKSGPVWFYNLEDPADELRRRMKALMMHYRVAKSELSGRLFLDSGRDRALIITKKSPDGTIIASPIIEPLVAELKRRGIVLFVVDPFVQSHTAEENNNEEMNAVMALWGQVAHRAGCAIWLIHHFRKGGQAGDSDSFRGAAAIQGAARVMSTLGAMSLEDANKLGIQPEERRQYVRLDNAKANMAPAPDRAEWYHLVNVELGNASPAYPDGDHVQTVEPWSPPSLFEGIDWGVIDQILSQITNGPSDRERYAASKQSGDRWVGNVFLAHRKTESQASSIIKAWLNSGLLYADNYKSPARNYATASCVSVDQTKAAEMRRSGQIPDGLEE